MALDKRYTSLSNILERVRREFGFEEVFPHDAKEWIWDAIGIAGAPEMLIRKTAVIEIKNWRGELPHDLFSLADHQIRDKESGKILQYSENSFHQQDNLRDVDPVKLEQGRSVHYEESNRDPDSETVYNSLIYPDHEFYGGFGYIVNDYYIFTAIKNMELEMTYTAFPIDNKTGDPLVPDDPKVIRAIVWYIGERTAFKLMLADRLSERKYEIIKQDYLFNIGSAISQARISSIPEFENFKNRAMQIFGNPFPYKTAFK